VVSEEDLEEDLEEEILEVEVLTEEVIEEEESLCNRELCYPIQEEETSLVQESK
jgi:hypothetical protein